MLELTIRCTCKICNEPLVISSLQSDYDLYNMEGNKNLYAQFAAYHHEGFGDGKEFASVTCKKCNAEYIVATDVISVFCSIDDLEEEYEDSSTPEFDLQCKGITFHKWLKNQRDRTDTVGDLAKEAFYTEGLRRETKKEHDRKYPGRPKNANSYEAWVSFLDRKKDALAAFRMAWAEYKHQKQYCRIK